MHQPTVLLAVALIGGVAPANAQAPTQQPPTQQRPPYHGAGAKVSPDGKHVLFGRDSAAGVMFVMNPDGSDQRPLPSEFHALDWMPDSKRLLVGIPGSTRSAPIRLATVNLDGSGLREIPTGNAELMGAAMLVGEKTILFPSPVRDSTAHVAVEGTMRDNTGRRVPIGIFFMDLDGQNVRPVSVPKVPGQRIGSMVPSHDGRRFAFTAADTTDPTNFPRSGTLYVANTDGSGLRAVATLPSLVEQPAWSHDDRTIVMVDAGRRPRSTPPGSSVPNSSLVIVNVETGATRPIAHGDKQFLDEVPCWSSDGYIYFQSDSEGRMEIFRMKPDGSNRTRLTR